jgi:hypothetical protein
MQIAGPRSVRFAHSLSERNFVSQAQPQTISNPHHWLSSWIYARAFQLVIAWTLHEIMSTMDSILLGGTRGGDVTAMSFIGRYVLDCKDGQHLPAPHSVPFGRV